MATSKAPDNAFNAPGWLCKPKLENCGLYVMKENKRIQTLTAINRKPYVLFGRNAQMSDIKLEHPSISRRHALIGHGSSGNIYVMDLGSSHGTFLNGTRLTKKKREPLRDGFIIKFGASTRQYVVKLDLDNDNDNDIDNNNDQQTTKQVKNKSKKRKHDQTNGTNGGSDAKRIKLDLPKVSCRHLLVKHIESRRPKSWKTDNITRSKDDALNTINKFRDDLLLVIDDSDKLLNKFKELASKESDCNSYKRGGDLGSFGKGRMQKPFEIAAFNLNINELSEPVITNSGIHLILRYA